MGNFEEIFVQLHHLSHVPNQVMSVRCLTNIFHKNSICYNNITISYIINWWHQTSHVSLESASKGTESITSCSNEIPFGDKFCNAYPQLCAQKMILY